MSLTALVSEHETDNSRMYSATTVSSGTFTEKSKEKVSLGLRSVGLVLTVISPESSPPITQEETSSVPVFCTESVNFLEFP